MKKLGQWAALPALLMILFAFTSRPGDHIGGGDYFEVYLGSELVVQQSLHERGNLKTFHLRSAHYNEKLSVRYSHCGVAGKKRKIELKDESGRVLRSMSFAESKSANGVMVCQVSEVLDLQPEAGQLVSLFYYSAELPAGKCLVKFRMG